MELAGVPTSINKREAFRVRVKTGHFARPCARSEACRSRRQTTRKSTHRPAPSGQTQTPEQFFGFKIGTDGELARYPKILEYLQHLSKTTNRLKYQEVGKTTMGNPYVLATISAPENLAKLDRLVEINRRLADPRGLSEAEARRLAQEGRAFYFVYGTIHSTEVGNTQSLIEIAHRLATDGSPEIKQILDNVVVLLVPSQNPDGQVPRHRSLVQDEGHAVHARVSGPVSQVRGARRQP